LNGGGNDSHDGPTGYLILLRTTDKANRLRDGVHTKRLSSLEQALDFGWSSFRDRRGEIPTVCSQPVGDILVVETQARGRAKLVKYLINAVISELPVREQQCTKIFQNISVEQRRKVKE